MSRITKDLDDDAAQLRSEALWGVGLIGGVLAVVLAISAVFGA